jgi:hypothetical protein
MHLGPLQMAELRAELAKGGLEASLLAAQLLEIVEKLQTPLHVPEELAAQTRLDLAEEEAAALAAHLADAAAAGKECPTCHNAEARDVVARLKRIAGGADANGAYEPGARDRVPRRRSGGRRNGSELM